MSQMLNGPLKTYLSVSFSSGYCLTITEQ